LQSCTDFMRTLSKVEFFDEVVKLVVECGVDEDHVIATMILLHCFRLTVGPNIQLSDAGDARELAPITRSHAAECVAKFAKPKKRPLPAFYWQDIARRMPYDVAGEITADWQQRVDRVIALLIADNLISQAVADN
jgi:hypothetical protein